MLNGLNADGRYSPRKLLMAGVASVAVLGGGYLLGATHGHAQPITVSNYQVAAQPSFAPLAERVRPAVVSVRVVVDQAAGSPAAASTDEMAPQLREFLKRFGAENGAAPHHAEPRKGVALGSGFFVSADGHVVTNNHVVENAVSVSIAMDDGRVVDAHVVGADAKTDLALLKVDRKGDYPFVALAKETPRVGDWVLAIGNPFGLGGSVTAGIVSANGRDIGAGPYDDFLQIDAPINKGNSGGPTFNLKGEVVGVNTMIFSPSGGSVGLAFAVPARTVATVVDALERHGSVARGYLGVQVQDIDEPLAKSLSLSSTGGALVDDVVAGSVAAKAGLKSGDVIVKIDGAPLPTARDLIRRIGSLKPGDSILLGYLRDGHQQEVKLSLGRQQEVSTHRPPADQPKADETPAMLGVRLAPMQDQAGPGKAGVLIAQVDPNGAAAEKGIAGGDVILEVDGKPVFRPSEVKDAILSARNGGRPALLLKLRSAEGQRYVAFALAKA